MRFIARILFLVSLAATFVHAQTLPSFQHIIVVVQENRTPDNLFGGNPTFEPGVDIQQSQLGQPWCLGACFDPNHTHASWEAIWGNGSMCNGGKSMCTNKVLGCNSGTTCNGKGVSTPNYPQETYVSTTDDQSKVAPYFDIATKYGFANYFFQTNQGPSFPAHQFLFAGTSAPTQADGTKYQYFAAEIPYLPGGKEDTGCAGNLASTVAVINQYGSETAVPAVFPCFHNNSLPTLLDPNHKSWKYYGVLSGGGQANGIWTAPNAIYDICMPLDGLNSVCTGSDWVNDVVFGTAQILLDLGAVGNPSQCTLRNVSWVIPNGDRSDHPGLAANGSSTDIEGGPAWVASIINAVGQTTCTDQVNGVAVPYWKDTAVFVVWDDWGGWWDHIQPYEVLIQNQTQNCDPTKTFGCGYVSGFRVPFLVVSAHTPAGYVSGDTRTQGKQPKYTHDFGSILAFIENNFGLTIGSINPKYRYADAFAPDLANGTNIPLSDFFPIPQNQPRQFQAITLPPGALSATDFINYTGPILDPDNDAIDND